MELRKNFRSSISQICAVSVYTASLHQDAYHSLYTCEDDLQSTIKEHLTFYNRQRPHRKLNMQTPVSFEAEFYYFMDNYGEYLKSK